MNWVAPIKDEETLRRFKEELKQMDDGLFREDWGGLRKILTEGENV